ncbi:hypothetical protein CEXT_530961, partial [Caerostris extrusa]
FFLPFSGGDVMFLLSGWHNLPINNQNNDVLRQRGRDGTTEIFHPPTPVKGSM